jgi:hypothetical protein
VRSSRHLNGQIIGSTKICYPHQQQQKQRKKKPASTRLLPSSELIMFGRSNRIGYSARTALPDLTGEPPANDE